MSERNGVEIDYCPECRGVWLDRGELDKIIDKSVITAPDYDSRQDDNSRSQQHHQSHQQHQQHGEYYKKKRKDSFLGDLFDF
jgi:hypothetical protein